MMPEKNTEAVNIIPDGKFYPKTDCFAYENIRKREICSALNYMVCQVEGTCPFYKSHWEMEAERKKYDQGRNWN